VNFPGTRARSRERTRPPRRETELTFLRLVPGNSFVHRLWAGTKLLVAAGLALVLSIEPSWQMLGIGVAIVGIGLLAGRIPLGAFPRLPRWFWGLLLIGAALSTISGMKPTVDVAGISLSIGALGQWAQFTLLAAILIVSGMLIGWTTPLGDIAPALDQMFGWLRKFRVPVDEWIVAIALAIRCLPLLIDEIRILNAARRLRSHESVTEQPGRGSRSIIIELFDLLSTAIVASVRRSRDLAEAIIARGGIGGTVSAERKRPRLVDYVVIAAAAALYVVSLVVLHL
jgi:energy-coupling factor transporter transmembrane protein EcfT